MIEKLAPVFVGNLQSMRLSLGKYVFIHKETKQIVLKLIKYFDLLCQGEEAFE